jgi:hypothetical protein
MARIDALGDEGAFVQAIIEAGSEAGFHFDEAEVVAALRFSKRDPSEIDDSQLEAVAGGVDAPKDPPPKTTYLVITMKDVLISG